jgi:hypothetical protein
MPNGYLVEQNAHGRWYWGVITSDSDFTRNTVRISTVTFPSEKDADHDFQEHLDAATDETGRLIRSRDAIRGLIRAAVHSFPECENSYFGTVHWQPADEFGCNWQLSNCSGSSWNKCVDSFAPFLQRLREIYNIPPHH